MAENEKPPALPDEKPHTNPWAKPVMWLGIVAILCGSMVYIFKSCRDFPVEVISKAGQALTNVASMFGRRSVITTNFGSYATAITNTQNLQLCALKQMEIFTRTEGFTLLPDVIAEARAPVEYTYYIDLNEPWRLLLKDGVIYVSAPQIRPNKPAIDVSKLDYEVRKGALNPLKSEVLESLKQSITPLVNANARDRIPVVRENVRKGATEFVEKWLMKSFTDGKQYPVKLYFADEKPPGGINFKDGPLN
jgi:hypothetical protein